jgi:microcystin-dependent protein
MIPPGTPYCVTFNQANSAWVLVGLMGVQPVNFNVPLGAMLDYTGPSAPNSSFVFPFGQQISRTTYATYFVLVGIQYGSGNGSTTFNVPDLRGRVAAGIDNMGGTNANLLNVYCSDTTLGASCGAQNQTIAQANLPNLNFNVSIGSGQGSHTHGVTGGTIGGRGFYQLLFHGNARSSPLAIVLIPNTLSMSESIGIDSLLGERAMPKPYHRLAWPSD